MRWIPIALVVVVLHHVDVLGIVRSKQNFGLGSGLLHIVHAKWHVKKILGSLVELRNACREIFLTHGTKIGYGVLHIEETIHQLKKLSRICVAKLFLAEDIGVGVVRSKLTILHESCEALLLVILCVSSCL